MDEMQIISAPTSKEQVNLQTLINIYKGPLGELERQALKSDNPSPAVVKAIRLLSDQLQIWQDAVNAGSRVQTFEEQGFEDLDLLNNFVADFIVSRGLQRERSQTLGKARDHTLT